jgi:hypothetical protein
VAELVRDGIALCAAASITYGVWLIYEPAGFIVAGLLALAGLYLHVSGSKSQVAG